MAAVADSTVVACYRRGVRIMTDKGEAPIEELTIGDELVTFSGAIKPIRWIGSRAYDGRFIAGNRAVLPICVTAGALSDGVPARDLWVSPEHALYIDGALVPARLIVNDLTIAQIETVERVEYFHIEFDDHDILFAERAPAESYIEWGNRMMFANSSEYARLYPQDGRPRRHLGVPRLEWDSPKTAAVRARLLARALDRLGQSHRGFAQHSQARLRA
jgi:O-antigen biosynthesis protein